MSPASTSLSFDWLFISFFNYLLTFKCFDYCYNVDRINNHYQMIAHLVLGLVMFSAHAATDSFREFISQYPVPSNQSENRAGLFCL